MRRRLALCTVVALAKTALFSTCSTCVRAAEQAVRVASRMAGPHWSVNGDWSPSLEAIQRHLRGAHGIDPGGLDLEQLLVIHDNDHNRMGPRSGGGKREAPKASAKGYRAI